MHMIFVYEIDYVTRSYIIMQFYMEQKFFIMKKKKKLKNDKIIEKVIL